MPAVDLLCLANSVKMGGRCIAGLRLDGRGWVRPVANTEHGELLRQHYGLPRGDEPRVLDEIRVPLGRPKPEPHQPENWELETGDWELIRRPASSRSLALLGPAETKTRDLFGTTTDSVSVESLSHSPPASSLALVRAEDLHFYKSGWMKPRAVFQYGGQTYDFVVTDPPWRQRILQLEVGRHSSESVIGHAEPYMTVSLGEPFQGQCYKLVAAIFPRPGR